MNSSRVVHCCDAVAWLESQPVMDGCSFITSLPDISELTGHSKSLSLSEYKHWFIKTAQLVLNRCPDNGVCVFFQTDIKVDGTWLDKAYLCQRAAECTGHSLLWHKVVCRVAAGGVTYSRPSYHHMLCFSKGVRTDAAASTADVLPSPGSKTWARGMGTAACEAACRFVRDHTATRTVVDPFCGHGTVLAVANQLGLNAVGVELSPKRARQAEQLTADGLQLSKGSSNSSNNNNNNNTSNSHNKHRGKDRAPQPQHRQHDRSEALQQQEAQHEQQQQQQVQEPQLAVALEAAMP